MDPTFVYVSMGLALTFGLYMAWNIGANDVANAMGTSVGSKALTIKQAVIVAAIFEFSGAFLVGGNVTDTIRKGIFDPSLFANDPHQLVVGMLAALLSAALWLQIASWKGLPVSTTHSIVGAVIGFSVVAMGFGSVSWGKVLSIVASWFVSPVCGGLLAFIIFTIVRRAILDRPSPIEATRKVAPVLVFVLGLVLGLVLLFKGLKNLHLGLSTTTTVAIALGFGVVGAAIVMVWLRNFHPEGKGHGKAVRRVEKVFAWLQIVTACFMAFAHGSNDVANAVGPLAGIVATLETGAVAAKAAVPLWVLGLGGVGIVIGLATWGRRVIETIGRDITEMTPTRGFAAEFGACVTILAGSSLGLPLSTTHVLVGAVIGVGFARGISALNMKVIRSVASSWVLTVPIAAITSAILFKILMLIIPPA